jgi:hypothetical protein
MPIGKAIQAAGNTVSQYMKYQAARKAAEQQQQSIKKAKAETADSYNTAIGYQQPYTDAGKQTIGELSAGLQPGGDFNRNFTMADFKADPGYEFRQQQGLRAVDQGAAARGGVLSGAALKGEQQFGQDLASNEYQSAYQRFNTDMGNRFNRLSSVAQMGQGAANNSSNLTTNKGNTISDLELNNGNVRAAKEIAMGNANASSNQGAANFVASLYGGGGSSFGGSTSYGGGK